MSTLVPPTSHGIAGGIGSVTISAIADPGAGFVIGSSGGQAAAVHPPGFEIGYDQITASVVIASTAEATGTVIIPGTAHTFDGATVMAEFWTPIVVGDQGAVGDRVVVSLFEGATQIGRFFVLRVEAITAAPTFPGPSGRLRFAPTAGPHTYSVTAFADSLTGTPAVSAGAGGTSVSLPAFLRFTKV